MFEINKQLENDSIFIVKLKLCQLRLMKDGELDWFLLIPERENISEWFELEQKDQNLLSEEIVTVSSFLKKEGRADKINVANLGNIVSQFHVHIIGRKKTDRAWPSPIWGTKSTKIFSPDHILFWQKFF